MIARLIRAICICLCSFVFITSLSEYATAFQIPQYQASADSLFTEAENIYNGGNVNAAEALFDRIIEMQFNQRTTAAKYMKCRIMADRSDYDNAMILIDKFSAKHQDSKYFSDILLLKSHCFYQKKLYLFALEELLIVITRYKESENLNDAIRNFCNLFEPDISEFVLSQLEMRFPDAEAAGLIAFKRAQIEVYNGDFDAAFDYLQHAQRNSSYPAAIRQINDLLIEIENELSSQKYITVLMPLSGEFSNQALGVYRGVKLALDKYNEYSSFDIGIKVVNTRSSANEIIKIMNDISIDKSILGIIGPVDPLLQIIATPLAKLYEIPLILPVNFRDIIIEENEFVFRIIGSAESEGAALARFAVEKMGFKNLGILSPLIGKEERIASSFVLEAERLGGNVLNHEWYYPGAIQFNQQFSRIRRTGFEMMMDDSLRIFVKDMKFDSLTIATDSLTDTFMDSVIMYSLDTLSIVELDSIKTIFQDSLRSRRLQQGIYDLDSLRYPVTKYDALFIPVNDPEELDFVINQVAYH
ncbi:hypothetical protein ACFL67_04255, partial [candidate division KSB1 bacterium]